MEDRDSENIRRLFFHGDRGVPISGMWRRCDPDGDYNCCCGSTEFMMDEVQVMRVRRGEVAFMRVSGRA